MNKKYKTLFHAVENNLKLEKISFDTIAKAVKNCTDIKSNNFLTWSDFESVDYPIKKKLYSLIDDPERGCFDSDTVDEMIEDSHEVKK